MEFTISMGFEDNAAVINCGGSLLVEFKEKLLEEVDKAFSLGVSYIAIGLKDVTFLDSSGISALIAAKKRAAVKQGDVRLFELSPAVDEVGHWVGLREKFQVFNTKKSCLDSYQDTDLSFMMG